MGIFRRACSSFFMAWSSSDIRALFSSSSMIFLLFSPYFSWNWFRFLFVLLIVLGSIHTKLSGYFFDMSMSITAILI